MLYFAYRETKILEEQKQIQRVLQEKIQAYEEHDDDVQSQDRYKALNTPTKPIKN